jgi:excisionase family DNA binding protein
VFAPTVITYVPLAWHGVEYGENDMIESNGPPAEALWDAGDVARYLKASRSYVYKAAEAGALPSLRIGSMLRFDPARIRAFAHGGSEPAAAKLLPFGRPGR